VHCILYAGDNGGQPGIAEIHNDVTDLRRVEAEIRDSDRRKDLFVATLAHELRNPLAPLQSGLEVLRMSQSGSTDARSILEIMQRQLDHIVRMVDDLLDVSRINTGKIELRRTSVLLADVFRDAIEACRPQLDAARHELQVVVPEQAVTLHADAARLVQVLVNLLSNAAKFTPAGGRIRLTGECDGAEVVIRVRDNGAGIRLESLPHIFDMFSQVEDVHRRSAGGLGLGLNIVRTFVEMHGGTVAAHSDGLGCGAEFTLRLPANNAAPQATVSAPGDPRANQAGTHRVLVVDDNQDAARTLSLLLNKIGFECRNAFDGPSALTVAGEFDPHAIVLDLGMPGMDGLEVAQHLRTPPQSSKALLIALTGWDKDEDRRNTRAAGFDHHLAKPVQLDTLQRLLQSLGTTTSPTTGTAAVANLNPSA
jgi:CheY-like chemotaxis protein/nitrogen-specific signal transduction histidine kinase